VAGTVHTDDNDPEYQKIDDNNMQANAVLGRIPGIKLLENSGDKYPDGCKKAQAVEV
jgi:hypothetical protein